MNMESIMQAYIDALEKGDIEAIISLFSPSGTVASPLYGNLKAPEFYHKLSKDTSDSKIEFKNSFVGKNRPYMGAIQFNYQWTLASGEQVIFDCMDIFEFDEKTSKIQKLTIIYDTYPVRNVFAELKNNAPQSRGSKQE